MLAMTNSEIADHTTRILRTATADETMATDAMTATAQALAILVLATAKREGVAFEGLLKEMLHAVASFVIDMDARSRAG
jgi:transposase